MTTPNWRPRRFSRFGRSEALILSLALSALSHVPANARASDSAAQGKNHSNSYALIIGTVWGPDDKPVYGVKVKIRRVDEKKPRWEVQSDHNGEFAQRVPAGKADYQAWADLKGYKSSNGNHLQPGDRVAIHVEYDERVDTSLHLKQ